jgi:hypothetical protein
MTFLKALERANPDSPLDFRKVVIFEGANDGLNRRAHGQKALPESIVVGARWRRLIYRYIKHEIGICLHICPRSESGKAKSGNFSLVFQKSVTGNGHLGKTDSLGQTDLRARAGGPRRDDVKPPVAVVSRPPVEDAKCSIDVQHHQFGREFGNLVRLYRFDDRAELIREWLDVPGSVWEVAFQRADRKRKVMFIGGRVFPCFKDDGSIDRFIQGRSKVIKDLSKVKSETGREWLFRAHGDAPCPAVIHVHRNRIGIALNEPIPCSGESIVLGVCPLDALPTAVELAHIEGPTVSRFV